jgi:hypothetical protein
MAVVLAVQAVAVMGTEQAPPKQEQMVLQTRAVVVVERTDQGLNQAVQA